MGDGKINNAPEPFGPDALALGLQMAPTVLEFSGIVVDQGRFLHRGMYSFLV
jgi:hypothetical protein